MKKYELIKSDIEGLFRVKALRAFGNVQEGEIGGYVEKEENLSQEGNAWVYNNAHVCGNAEVYGNAQVCSGAHVCGNAEVYGNAQVYGNAAVRGGAEVFGNAHVCGNAQVYGDAWVYGDACVYGNAQVYGDADVRGDACVYGNALVYGDVYVCGNAQVQGNAAVRDVADYIVFKNWWSSGRWFTWTRSNNMWTVGCFYGTGERLIKKAYADNEESGREYGRVVRYVESILNDNN